MRQRLLIVLTLAALGCRAGARESAALRPGGSPEAGAARDEDEGSAAAARERGESLAARSPAPEARTPVVAAEPTHCERACAEVHACLLAEDAGDPAAAASIELGCLDACIDQPERETLFGCQPQAGACGPFLACVRDAWPEPQRPDQRRAGGPVILPSGSGCELACEAFARCHGIAPSEEWVIAECVKMCDSSLDEELERQAGACALLGECSEITACIEALPGA